LHNAKEEIHMEFPVTQGAYNLLEERWIPVLYGNGKNDRVGICQALTDAHKIRQIAASNPMDRVALLRFLLAVLMWCKEDAKSSLAALAEKSVGISENWLAKLEENKAAFNLFDEQQPFMQDLAVKGEKTNAATELIHDLPSGSALNHFRHTRDKEDGLCPACCALGLVRWPCYATAGTKGAGKSMTASPNGNTPTYAFPVCNTLLQCLWASLERLTASPKDTPIWLSNGCPDELGPLSGLTWRSRSVLLTMPTENDGSQCCYCGATEGGLIREIHFQPGWKRLSAKPWDADPHLVLVARKKKNGAVEPVLVVYPSPNDPVERPAMLWRDLTQGVFESTGADPKNSVPHDVVVLGSVQALLKHCETIRVKPIAGAAVVDLSKNCVDALRCLVKHTTPNKKTTKDEHSEVNASVVLVIPDAESRLCAALEHPTVSSLPDAEVVKLLREIYEPVVAHIVASTATGSPLRRRAAKNHAQALLNKKIKELVEKPDHPSNAGTPAAVPGKPKLGRKKGGSK